jgi:hypothetical protein
MLFYADIYMVSQGYGHTSQFVLLNGAILIEYQDQDIFCNYDKCQYTFLTITHLICQQNIVLLVLFCICFFII